MVMGRVSCMGVAGTAARMAVLILSVPAGGVGGIICYTCDDKGTEVGGDGGGVVSKGMLSE
jgi:hypothetical protein